ncbi:MAG TPA: DUF6456 domain-containing protein [Asticcacaulis sp.]|nr:DUF6456 domain-containing protein [Asticcacaulis sp.]
MTKKLGSLLRTQARRLAAEGPAAQAFVATDAWQVDGNGRNVKRQVNTAESPIAWLMRHKDANGLSFLTRSHLAALEKLREDHLTGYAQAGLTSNWDGFGGGGRSGFRRSGDDPHVFRLAARSRAEAALNCLEAPLRAVFERVCLEGTALGVIERGFKLPRRSAKHHVRAALDRLARYYGY